MVDGAFDSGVLPAGRAVRAGVPVSRVAGEAVIVLVVIVLVVVAYSAFIAGGVLAFLHFVEA